MSYIYSALKKYNANSNNKRTGDCVARSLSLAFGLDYDEVKKTLKANANRYSGVLWNSVSNFAQFIDMFAAQMDVNIPAKYSKDNSLTVAQLAHLYSDDTLIILCGDDPRHTSHLVCAMNGDIYDTWDSSDCGVNRYWVVPNNIATDVSDKSEYTTFIEQLDDVVKKYIEKCLKKTPYFSVKDITHRDIDDETHRWTITIAVNKYMLSEDVQKESWSIRDLFAKEFFSKWNIKADFDTNFDKNKTKICYNIREWLYQSRRVIEEIDEEAEARRAKHPDFWGDALLLSKLPEACKSLVVFAYDNGSSYYDPDRRFEVRLEPLQDDPRFDLGTVYLEARNLTELRSDINEYLKDFSRPGYDY